MTDLREMFPAYRWRWSEDHDKGTRFDPFHVELPGRYGKVYLHGVNGSVRLQAYTDRRLVRGRLAALPNVTVHQWGEDEATVTFAPKDAAPVFALLRCWRKGGNGRFPDSASGKDGRDGDEPREGLAGMRGEGR